MLEIGVQDILPLPNAYIRYRAFHDALDKLL
jgi:hypothetical protein